MSRWHRYAFTIDDEGKVMKITRSSSGKKLVLSIDGLVRTEVDTCVCVVIDYCLFMPKYLPGMI